MSKTTQSTAWVATPDATDRAGVDDDAPITEKTAAQLRTLCGEKGEAFDTALTEGQARERIAALQDMDGTARVAKTPGNDTSSSSRSSDGSV